METEPPVRGNEPMQSTGTPGGSSSSGNLINFPENDSQIKHIFRDKPGHLPDTPSNRKLLKDVANDSANTLGNDRFGNTWHAKTLLDGTQAWVQTRNNKIINGGLNEIPKTYDPRSGLSNPNRP